MDLQAILDGSSSSESSDGVIETGDHRHDGGLGLNHLGLLSNNNQRQSSTGTSGGGGGNLDIDDGSTLPTALGTFPTPRSNAAAANHYNKSSSSSGYNNYHHHDNHFQSHSHHHKQTRNNLTMMRMTTTQGPVPPNSAVDLEQILREDDDDEDDDDTEFDDDDDDDDDDLQDNQPPRWMTSTSTTSSGGGGDNVDDLPDTYTATTTTGNSNQEDWDVLQAILGEDDDDDDDDDEYDQYDDTNILISSNDADNILLGNYDDDDDDDSGDDDDDDDWNMYQSSTYEVSNTTAATATKAAAARKKKTTVLVDTILKKQSDENDTTEQHYLNPTSMTASQRFFYNASEEDNAAAVANDSNNINRKKKSSSAAAASSSSSYALQQQQQQQQQKQQTSYTLESADSFLTAVQSASTGASSSACTGGNNSSGNIAVMNSLSEATTMSSNASSTENHHARDGGGTDGGGITGHGSSRTASSSAVSQQQQRSLQSSSSGQSQSELLQVCSENAIKYAQTYERKLLRSGHRDIVSPLMVKRRLKPKIELNTKQQQLQREKESKQTNKAKTRTTKSSTTTSNTTSKTTTTNPVNTDLLFGFSGVVETKTMGAISKRLITVASTNRDYKTGDPDLPTALATNSRFIAIGLQSGTIQVFDWFEVLKQSLPVPRFENNSTDKVQQDLSAAANANLTRKAGAITSMDMSQIQNEILCAGHTSGLLVLWDTIKGVMLRTVMESSTSGTPASPITMVRFFHDLKLVSVDAGGLVNKLAFSKNILFANYSVESECLLDGTAGQILAMHVLKYPPPKNYRGSAVQQQQRQLSSNQKGGKNDIILIALSSERSSFAVAVEPAVHVLHRWARPPIEKVEPPTDDFYNNTRSPRHNNGGGQQQVYLPCLSWGWALVSGGGHQVTPILARAWGCCLQLLRAHFPEGDEVMAPPGDIQWPAFGVHDEFQVTAPVVAMEWLNDRSLVYLTVNNEFTVIDTVMMTLLERLDFSGLKLVFAEFSLSRKVAAEQQEQQQQSVQMMFCTTFQNSFRSCDDRVLWLCQEALMTISIVGAKQRISGREQDGEWLEALALSLDHYETTISSQVDRQRKTVKDLSKHPEYSHGAQISEDEEWIAKLLIRYLNTAVENAPETTTLSTSPTTKEWMESQLELAQSHFQMLAGVCVEFCVTTKRLDLLFGPIFRRFQSVGYLHVFLDVLEPYILNDKLDYIAPEAMAHFVEHCRATNGIATVERCLLHMDVTIMDFDSILSLLKANEMYSALFYVFNQGLQDFTTPLEILLEKMFDVADMVGVKVGYRRPDGVPQNDFERYGYKAILYLQSCFSGNCFPQEHQKLDEDLVRETVRPQLLKFLLQKRFTPSRTIVKNKNTTLSVIGQRAVPYPYTHILLMVDPKIMFETISIAMNASDYYLSEGFDESGWHVEVGNETGNDNSESQPPDRQEIISMFSAIIIPDKADIATTHQTTLYQSKVAVNSFLDFLAEYLMKGVIRANRNVTLMVLNRMAHRFASADAVQDRRQAQRQILQLLSALPRTSYDPEQVLILVQQAGIHRAALLLHQEGAEEHGWSMQRRTEHFISAINCYLDDEDADFQKEVFAYVKKECSAVLNEDTDAAARTATNDSADSEERDIAAAMKDNEISSSGALLDGLTSKLAELVHLDPLLSAELVAELFVEDIDRVIYRLGDDEEAKFMLFQAIISGDLIEMDPVAGGVLNAHLTMEHHHKYLGLMAKLHPELVYDYLSSHDNYRPGECLKLCQKYEIADASAYLLERMGNVSSALQLILQTLESRMMGLKRTIRGMGTDFFTKYVHSRRRGYPHYRHHHRPRHGAAAILYDKQEQEINGVKRILIVALDLCERNSGSFSSRTEHGSQLWFNVLDRLINAKGFLRLSKEQAGHAKVMAGVLSELLRLTMQRMVSSVPLPDLVRKVTSDHSGSRLGELREMIESLLSTYGLELEVFGGATKVFHYDAQQMQYSHRRLRIRGAVVQSVMNVPLLPASSDTVVDSSPAADSQQQQQQQQSLALQYGGRNNILQLSGTGGHAVVIDQEGRTQFRSEEQHEQQGFGNSIAKLRSRRGRYGQDLAASSNRPMDRCRSTGLNFMTTQDQSLRRGEISPDVTYFEDRIGGNLGEAEHRGRLMSFLY